MRPLGTVATAMLLAASAVGFVGPASTARAYTKEEIAINGTYRVTSIGNWAKINDQYNGEPTTVQTWTLNSTCTSYQECDGTLKSDEGWSARLYMRDGTLWYAKHEIPNWERSKTAPHSPESRLSPSIPLIPGEAANSYLSRR